MKTYRSMISLTFLLFAAFFLWTHPASANSSPKKIKCSLNPIERHNSNPQELGILPHLPIRESTSLNWSGYAAATNIHNPGQNTVTAVSASWTIPRITRSTSSRTYSSMWVGIDGYTDATVEQIGTEQDWINGSQQNYAWFEMYPIGSFEIVGFPVNVGDHISASVVYSGNSVFKLTLTNNTRNVTYTVPRNYTTSIYAQRSSAEWILEAPYLNGVLPLADFGVASFTNCLATINGISGAINNSHWQYDPLTMETANSIIKSLPSSLSSNGEAFSLDWEHE
jgi:hypothetical protein